MMKTVDVALTGSGVLQLGRQGENLARRLRFDLTAWRQLYGEGAGALLHRRYGDERPYAVAAEEDGDGAMVWTVTATDTASPGQGECQLQYLADETVVKSAVFATSVTPALGETGQTPEPAEAGYLQQVIAAGVQALRSAEEAREAQATAEDARAASQAAQDGAETAQAGAEEAQSAAETAWMGAQTARNQAEAAQIAAESARIGAESARIGAESAQAGAVSARQVLVARTASGGAGLRLGIDTASLDLAAEEVSYETTLAELLGDELEMFARVKGKGMVSLNFDFEQGTFWYCDEEGNSVDADGYLLDEDGEYVYNTDGYGNRLFTLTVNGAAAGPFTEDASLSEVFTALAAGSGVFAAIWDGWITLTAAAEPVCGEDLASRLLSYDSSQATLTQKLGGVFDGWAWTGGRSPELELCFDGQNFGSVTTRLTVKDLMQTISRSDSGTRGAISFNEETGAFQYLSKTTGEAIDTSDLAFSDGTHAAAFADIFPVTPTRSRRSVFFAACCDASDGLAPVSLRLTLTPSQEEGASEAAPKAISGVASVTVRRTRSGGEETYSASLGGTVYGGELDPVAGTLAETWGCVESYAGEELPNGWISSTGALTEGAQVVYPLAESVMRQLEAWDIKLLRGVNCFSSEEGAVTAVYRADATLLYEAMSREIQALSIQVLALRQQIETMGEGTS